MKRKLMMHGMVLFLLGLITGLLIPHLRNPRSGLAAHLEGVMNGMFLVLAGLAWQELKLGERAQSIAYRLVLVGTWLNWATILMTAVLGTSKATPMAGAGYSASPAEENLVLGLLIVVVLTMVGALALFIAGLRGTASERPA